MAEVFTHKERLFGRKMELHIAPEGLTLVGKDGAEAVEFAPLDEISSVGRRPGGRKTSLTVSFKADRAAWTLRGVSATSADWLQALIEEERAASAKRARPEYSQKMPLERFSGFCASVMMTSDGRAAVDMVDFLLAQGILHGASDVHFDPFSDAIVVRYRLDGVLHDVAKLDASIKAKLTTRLKVVSRLATFKRGVAQEGRAALRMGNRTVDLRFSSLPTIHGEKVTVRIFDPGKGMFAIDEIGMSSRMADSFKDMLMKPQGTILLTGPSSSGKTTTMYSSLNYLRDNRRNLSSIATVEDPVEYDLQVVNQTQVNNASGLTFANALRTVLRQDPEVIMIGEIRDKETADIAVQAGLTGHMVLSTVHARSAAGVMLRMVDLGVEPYMLTSSVSAVLSQRLVRKICSACAAEYTPSEEERARFGIKGGERFFAGRGCEKCDHTGYSGRIGIFQLAPVSDAMRELVLKNCSLGELEAQFEREGLATMLDDGLIKAKAGVSTLEELSRVLG